MKKSTIRTWHVVISGFLQHEGLPVGMVRLWHDLHESHAGPDAYVLFCKWNADWAALAELIGRYRETEEPRIAIYAYSWGGMSAVFLSRQLQRRGIDVKWMVLSDPVYRHSYPLGNWRTLVPWSEIVVPTNVDWVDSFRQRTSWLRAHRVVAADSDETHVSAPWMARHIDHSHMDDLVEFQKRCREVANIIEKGD